MPSSAFSLTCEGAFLGFAVPAAQAAKPTFLPVAFSFSFSFSAW